MKNSYAEQSTKLCGKYMDQFCPPSSVIYLWLDQDTDQGDSVPNRRTRPIKGQDLPHI